MSQQDAPFLLYHEDVQQFLRMFTERRARKEGGAVREPYYERDRREMEEIKLKLHAAFDEGVSEGLGGGEQFGNVHPVKLGQRLMKACGLNADAHERACFNEILAASFPKDALTGYYAKQSMPLIVGLAHEQAQSHGNDVPVVMIEGDFCNMGGGNGSVLGREGTDKLIHAICDMVQKEFKAEAKRLGLKHEMHGVRAGGDEVRIVSYGMGLEQVQRVLRERVHPKLNVMAAEFGVHDLAHTKKGKLPGFGAAFGAVDMAKEADPARIRALLDGQIEQQKLNDGLLRMGVVDKAGVERYLEQVYAPYLKEQKIEGRALEEKMAQARAEMTQRAKAIAQQWKDMCAPGSPCPPVLHGKGDVNPRAVLDGIAAQHKAQSAQRLAQMNTPQSTTSTPFAQEQVADNGEAPESHRLRKAMQAMKFDAIAKSKDELFRWNNQQRRYDLVRFFDAPDPATRCKSSQLMLEDAGQLLARHDGSMKVAHFELGNVNGLNNINYDIADAVLRETGKYLQQALQKHSHGMKEHALDFVYHEGGGKFKVMLPPDYPNSELQKVVQHVQQQLEQHVLDKTPQEFARATYANPSGGREASSASRLAELEQRLGQLAEKAPAPIERMGAVPHPKDSSKKLDFKVHAQLLEKQDICPGGALDKEKLADMLRSVGDKAEMAFNAQQHSQRRMG